MYSAARTSDAREFFAKQRSTEHPHLQPHVQGVWCACAMELIQRDDKPLKRTSGLRFSSYLYRNPPQRACNLTFFDYKLDQLKLAKDQG